MLRNTLLHLPQQAAFAAAFLAAVASAEPWTQEELLQSNKQLRVTEGVIACSVERTRAVILFDREGRAAALVAEEDTKAIRRLASRIELGETREAGAENCLVLLRECESSTPGQQLADQTPLQALAFLIEEQSYTPAALQADGRVLWATGKRQSIDLLVPTAGTDAIRGVELKASITLTEFAANVLAHKLGYPKTGESEAGKAAAAGKLHADKVFYYSKSKDAALAAVGSRAFFLEGGHRNLQSLLHKRPEQAFPNINPAAERPKDAPPQQAATTAKPLTPKEALRAFIDRLHKL